MEHQRYLGAQGLVSGYGVPGHGHGCGVRSPGREKTGQGEAHHRLVVAQPDLLGLGDVTRQRASRAGLDRAVEEPEVGQDHRRQVGVVADVVGEEAREAVGAAEEHLAAAAQKMGVARQRRGQQPVALVVVGERSGLRVEARQPVVGNLRHRGSLEKHASTVTAYRLTCLFAIVYMKTNRGLRHGGW